MMTRKFTNLAVLAALGLLTPIHANAFGLGKLELSSALNEPFKAEISITALKGDEAANLQVRLASNKEFEKAGIERSFMLTQLKFDVVKKSGGVKIVIKSDQAIREPFIDFLLTATTTNSGRLIREYTVLLDPPVSVFKKPVKTVKKATPAASTNNSYQYPASSVSATTSSATTRSSSNSYGPTKRNDTLWEVALKTRPNKKVSVHQMMMALLKSNPDAFHRGNVNGLKAGYTLSIPSEAEIYKLNRQQAVSAFQEQTEQWKNRNIRPAVKAEVTEKTNSADNVTDVKSAPTQEKKIETPDVTQEDSARLQLVVPTDKASLKDDTLSPLGGEKIKDLSEQLTLAQETIEGQTQENVDFKARMDAMEEQMETMRRLISLKDADLARLQSMLEKDQQLPDGMVKSELSTPSPAVDDSANKTEEASSAEISSVEKWESVIGQGSDAEIAIDSATIPVAAENITTDNAVTGLSDDLSTESTIDNYIATAKTFITENKVGMAIAGGSILLLLLILLMLKRRKESEQEWNETSVADAQDTNTPDSSNEVEVNRLQAADAVIEEPVIVPPVVEAKTVAELLKKAETLIAYADYQEAEAVLEQAKKQEPLNQTVLMKSLFVMFKLKQTNAFVDIASNVDFGKDTAEWTEISAWGRELAPLNTLFTDNSEPVTELNLEGTNSVANIAPVLDTVSVKKDEIVIDDIKPESIDINLNDIQVDDVTLSDNVMPTLDLADDKGDDLLSFDTSFDLEKEDNTLSIDEPLSFEIENDIEPATLSLDDEPTINIEELDIPDLNTLSIEDSALDNLDDLNVTAEAAEAAPVSDELEFDISGFDEIDEAETKLDLASAYADMGDPDGAKSILDEVLKEGNEEQKSRAQALLDNLS